MHDPDEDDLDRLFARAETATPPGDVGGRARARLRAIRGARRLTLVALADLAALAALAALAFVLGGAVAGGELPPLARLGLEDRALALEMRGEMLEALVRGVPWPYVLVLSLDGLGLAGLTRYLLRATDAVGGARGARR